MTATLKMKYTTKEGEVFEFEGETEDQITRLYNMVVKQTTAQNTDSSTASKKIVSKTRLSLPPDDEVEAFIRSRPNFEHDLNMVQTHFFGRTFPSRHETARMYHRTARQLRIVREKIEKAEGRMFKRESIDRNLTRFKLEPKINVLFSDEKR